MVHNLLWTGGFDSTFRLCQLSREDCVIQPIYLRYKKRPALQYELAAHERVLDFLAKKGHKAEILPVKHVDMDLYMDDYEAISAFERRCSKERVGGQYCSMAAFVNRFGYCELCQEGYVNRPGALTRMLTDGVCFKTDAYGNRFIDREKSDKDKVIVFGGYYFPVMHINNMQMLALLKEWGMYGVVPLVRFCMSGTEEACGYCVCCLNKYSISRKDFRFSKEAVKQAEICMYLRHVDTSKKFYRTYCNYIEDKKLCYLDNLVNNKIDNISLGVLYRKFDKLNTMSAKAVRNLRGRFGTLDDFIYRF